MEDGDETLVPGNTATNDCEIAQSEVDGVQTNAQANSERLMIYKMVNENFKSYAGTQELGPFHKVFTIYLLLR